MQHGYPCSAVKITLAGLAEARLCLTTQTRVYIDNTANGYTPVLVCDVKIAQFWCLYTKHENKICPFQYLCNYICMTVFVETRHAILYLLDGK